MPMLAMYRRLPDLVAMTRDGGWRKVMGEFLATTSWPGRPSASCPGMGRIGQEVAKRLQGWSTNIIYYDVFRRSAAEEAALNLTYRPLDDLFGEADVITLHTPLMAETADLVNAERLNRMKPTAVLVNAARGPGLRGRAPRGPQRQEIPGRLGLERHLEQEPPPSNHPRMRHPNTIITPHVAGPTWDSWPRRFANAYENCSRVARGEKPLWIVPELS